MKRVFYTSVNLLLVLLLLSCSTMPTKKIEGRVRLVGTAMFPSVVISTDDGKEFYFDESLFDEFEPYQNQTITIRAKVEDKELALADGSKKFVIPTIYEAEIIDIAD